MISYSVIRLFGAPVILTPLPLPPTPYGAGVHTIIHTCLVMMNLPRGTAPDSTCSRIPLWKDEQVWNSVTGSDPDCGPAIVTLTVALGEVPPSKYE